MHPFQSWAEPLTRCVKMDKILLVVGGVAGRHYNGPALTAAVLGSG